MALGVLVFKGFQSAPSCEKHGDAKAACFWVAHDLQHEMLLNWKGSAAGVGVKAGQRHT